MHSGRIEALYLIPKCDRFRIINQPSVTSSTIERNLVLPGFDTNLFFEGGPQYPFAAKSTLPSHKELHALSIDRKFELKDIFNISPHYHATERSDRLKYRIQPPHFSEMCIPAYLLT